MALRQIIGDLSATLASIARTRLELFSLEAAEQRARLLQLLALGLGATILSLLGLTIFSLGIALFFWETEYRYAALFIMALIYLVIASGLLLVLRYRLRFDPVPFAATLDELQRDVSLLNRLKEPDQPEHARGPQ